MVIIKKCVKKRPRNGSSSGSKAFVSEKANEKKFSEVANGKVVLGKVCDFAFFDSQQFGISDWFQEQSLMGFAQINCHAYTHLVRLFFTNLQVHDKGLRISTLVNGIIMSIDAKLISQIFNIPNDGLELYTSHSRTVIEGFDYDEEMMKYTGLDVIPKNFKPDASDFLLEYRLLHHIVTFVLFPRSGGKGTVTYFDAYVMWALVNFKKLNFPHLMIQHMIDVKKKKRTSLPYGMALTLIFKYFKLRMKNEEYLEPSPTDFYNEGTLKRFGYKKVDGVWVWKSNKGKGKEKNVDEDTSSSPQQAGFASSSKILQTLKTIVDGNTEIMEEVMMLKHNQEIMMKDIDDIRRHSCIQKDYSMENEDNVKEIRHNVNKLILESKRQEGKIEELSKAVTSSFGYALSMLNPNKDPSKEPTENFDLRREGNSKEEAMVID